MDFVFRPFEASDAETLFTWHYDPPYDRFDPERDDVEEIRAAAGAPNWFAADDTADGSLAGFLICRIGDGEVEIGLGLRPDLTGRGFGPPFTEASVELIRERWAPAAVTLDVLPWNERATRAYERAGFVRGDVYEKTFENGDSRVFLRMMRTLEGGRSDREMTFAFRPLTEADAEAVLTWRYDAPYQEYDLANSPSDSEEIRAAVGSPTWFAADAGDGSLAGFVDCRIGEGEAEDEVEVGLGLRPDLTGRGLGAGFVEAIVALIDERWAPVSVVLDVLPWNERAMRAYEAAGFARGPEHDRTFDGGVVVSFVCMRRYLRAT